MDIRSLCGLSCHARKSQSRAHSAGKIQPADAQMMCKVVIESAQTQLLPPFGTESVTSETFLSFKLKGNDSGEIASASV